MIEAIPADQTAAMVRAVNGLPFGPGWSALPDWALARLEMAQDEVSPLAKIVLTVEGLWGARGHLDDQQREVAVQAATFAAANHWNGLGMGRGLYIAQALRRDAGETVTGYEASNDPEALDGFGPPAEPDDPSD